MVEQKLQVGMTNEEGRMMHETHNSTLLSRQVFAWGVATRALPGQTVSGDLHLVKEFRDGALLAVVDGIGHGAEATAAAGLAVRILEAHAEEPPVTLIR